jgi:ribonuclease HII
MGCVVGPLVVAGVSAREDVLDELKELGVRDSKLLAPWRRAVLYTEVLRLCDRVHTEEIQPGEIDVVVTTGKRYRKLNFLEATYMARIADRLGAAHVLVDAPDTVPSRFQRNIVESMKTRCRVTAMHHADSEYVVVSAASIVAKVERDRAVERLRQRYGDFGSGYPSDPKTRAFLLSILRRGEEMPGFVRRSWKTLLRLGLPGLP